MAIEVEVLDLGINNLASLRRGFSDAGASNLRVVASGDQSRGADLMVLPGVGAFGAAMDALASRGLGDIVKDHVAGGGKLFGVCLGMQLLMTSSEESPGVEGLDIIPGRVRRLEPNAGARVPNMGWGSSLATADLEDFPILSKPVDYYFVHSFAAAPDDPADVLAVSVFGELPFVSAVRSNNVIGVQFHPEKSSRPGAQLLTEVLGWTNG